MRPVLLGLLLLGASCGPEEDTDTLCDREVPLTYHSFGQGFMDNYCTGCHSSIIADGQRRGAPVGIDFDTYAGVLQYAERLEERVLIANRIEDDNPMPPGGGPTTQDLDMLEEWLQCRVYDDKAEWENSQ